MKDYKIENDYNCYEMGDEKFHPLDGAGLVVYNQKEKYFTAFDKRKIELSITDYLGSLDAEHYYGSLKVSQRDLVKSKRSLTRHFLAWVKLPEKAKRIEIKLHRKIQSSKQAIYLNKKDGAGLYHKVKKGDWDYRFDNSEDLLLRAKEIYDKHFGSEWEIRFYGSVYHLAEFKKIFNRL